MRSETNRSDCLHREIYRGAYWLRFREIDDATRNTRLQEHRNTGHHERHRHNEGGDDGDESSPH
jgi:hypothetical protein